MTRHFNDPVLERASYRNDALTAARQARFVQAKALLVKALHPHGTQYRLENLLTVLVEGHVEVLAGNYDAARRAYTSALQGFRAVDCSDRSVQHAIRDCAWGLLTVAIYIGAPAEIRAASERVLVDAPYSVKKQSSHSGTMSELSPTRVAAARALSSSNKITFVLARNRFKKQFGRDVTAP